MANNKRKPTPSVLGNANLMDEILGGASLKIETDKKPTESPKVEVQEEKRPTPKNGKIEKAVESEKSGRNVINNDEGIVPDSNKEHVDYLFSIKLVDKMEEIFPRLRRQMPNGLRRAFSKSVFVEICVTELIRDFEKNGEESRLKKLAERFAEELSERRAGV